MAGTNGYAPRLKKLYREEIVSRLKEQFSYANVMQVPRLFGLFGLLGLFALFGLLV